MVFNFQGIVQNIVAPTFSKEFLVGGFNPLEKY